MGKWLVLFIILFTGCASSKSLPIPLPTIKIEAPAQAPAHTNPISALQAMSVRDLQGALDVMTKGNDKAGVQCLSYLLPKIEAVQAPNFVNPFTQGGGFQPLTDLATLRVAIHGSSGGTGFLEDLDLNCAALRTSIEVDLVKGVALGASIASGAGAGPGAMKGAQSLINLLKMGSGGLTGLIPAGVTP